MRRGGDAAAAEKSTSSIAGARSRIVRCSTKRRRRSRAPRASAAFVALGLLSAGANQPRRDKIRQTTSKFANYEKSVAVQAVEPPDGARVINDLSQRGAARKHATSS